MCVFIILTDIKSKLKNHYRAHRLSFWLNLVPDLHKPGSDDVPRSHHLLDMDKVRFIPEEFMIFLPAFPSRLYSYLSHSSFPVGSFQLN